MVQKQKKGIQSNIFRRKSRFLRRLGICLALLMVSAAVAIPILRLIDQKNSSAITIAQIESQWNEGDYQAVYDMTKQVLSSSPFHNAALAFSGYAGFYLAVSQIDPVKAQFFLDESINALRVAALTGRGNALPQIYYMLGRAYFYKNTLSSYHYYSDLAIKYLELSRREGYVAADIPECLGLSYASLDMTEQSIAAFTEALIVRESDILLLSIAEQYYKNSQLSAAKAYLHRVSTNTTDDSIRLKSKFLLGQILLDESDFTGAEKEFRSILEIDPNYADAFYGIGIVYESQGALVKARSEWRKALRINVEHQGALARMAKYK